MLTKYRPGWYETIRPGCQSSAAVIAPKVSAAATIDTVIDVGCGEGWHALAFADLGARVVGLDGEHVQGSPLGDRFVAHDITEPFPDLGAFDLAICLEVAEHLDAAHAPHLVRSLCELSDNVLFSAAIPRQGGVGHVNCQWPAYWAQLFVEHGYKVSGAIRWELWDDARVEPWYRQNLLLATQQPGDWPFTWMHGPGAVPLAVIHPDLHLS